MTKIVSNEINRAIKKQDAVKLAAVFKSIEKISESELKRLLGMLLKHKVTPVAEELLLLMDRSEISEEFVAGLLKDLSAVISIEANVVTSLITSGQCGKLLLPVRLAGSLHLNEALHPLHELIPVLTEEKEIIETLNTLSVLGDDRSLAEIKPFLSHSNPKLAEAALVAAGKIGGCKAIEIIQGALGKDGSFNTHAMAIISDMECPEALEALGCFLRSKDVDLRNSAVDRLVKKGPAALPILHRLLDERAPDLLVMTANALGFIAEKKSARFLVKLTRNNNSNVRYAAFESLGRIGSPLSTMYLPPGLLDDEPQVRVAAVYAVEANISDKSTVKGIRQFLDMRLENIEETARAAVVADSKTLFLALSENQKFKELFFKFYYELKTKEEQQNFLRFLDNTKKWELFSEFEMLGRLARKRTRLTVLVVDDSIIMHKIMGSALAPLNHRMVSAVNGIEALKILGQQKVDLIFTDMNMPEMNGVELIRNIRKKNEFISIPVVMITTQSAGLNKKLAVSAGANYFLSKPFKNEKLEEIIKDLLYGD